MGGGQSCPGHPRVTEVDSLGTSLLSGLGSKWEPFLRVISPRRAAHAIRLSKGGGGLCIHQALVG